MVTRRKTTRKTRRTTKKRTVKKTAKRKVVKKRTVKKKTTKKRTTKKKTTKKRTVKKKATKKRVVKTKLTDVKGVGDVMARGLKRAGVKDAKSLARRKPALLARIVYGKQRKEVGKKTASAIVRAAKRLVKKK